MSALDFDVIDGLMLGCVAVACFCLGSLILLHELAERWRCFCCRSDREYAYLVDWYTGSDSPVGAAHADRSAARYAHASEPPSAAGEGSRDEASARPADGFYASYAHAALSAGEGES